MAPARVTLSTTSTLWARNAIGRGIGRSDVSSGPSAAQTSTRAITASATATWRSPVAIVATAHAASPAATLYSAQTHISATRSPRCTTRVRYPPSLSPAVSRSVPTRLEPESWNHHTQATGRSLAGGHAAAAIAPHRKA